LKYVIDKGKKEFAADLETIYHASAEEQGYAYIVKVTEK